MSPKSILKKDAKKVARSIVWDENAIAAHDLTRGGRMKIDEPKTPFIHYSMDTDKILGCSNSLPPIELSEAMETVHLNSESSSQKAGEWSSGGEDNTVEEVQQDSIKHSQDFKAKRHLHYNMKEALARKVDLDED